MSVYTSVIRVEQEWVYIPVWSELNKNEGINVIRVEQEWVYISVWSELNKNECIYQCDQS